MPKVHYINANTYITLNKFTYLWLCRKYSIFLSKNCKCHLQKPFHFFFNTCTCSISFYKLNHAFWENSIGHSTTGAQSRPYIVGPPCHFSLLALIAWSSAFQSTLSRDTGNVYCNVSNGWPKHFGRDCLSSFDACGALSVKHTAAGRKHRIPQ